MRDGRAQLGTEPAPPQPLTRANADSPSFSPFLAGSVSPRRQALPTANPLNHAMLLGISLAVLLGAVTLRVEGTSRVVLPFISWPLPGVCTFQQLFGIGCPGCGLTRCFVSLGHAELAAAWRFSPAGIVLFALTAAQVPYRLAQLWRYRRGLPDLPGGSVCQAVFCICIGMLLIQWLARTFWG